MLCSTTEKVYFLSLKIPQLFGAISKFLFPRPDISKSLQLLLCQAFQILPFSQSSLIPLRFFLKMCHPEMSWVFHMKFACREWPFSVGFPSCSGERTSVATVTYEETCGLGSAACPTSPTSPFLLCHLLALCWGSRPPIVPQIHEPIPTSELLLLCCPEHTVLPDARLVLSSPLSVFNPVAPAQWILWPSYLPGLPFPALFLSFMFPATQHFKYFINLPVSFPAVDCKFSEYSNFCLFYSLLTLCSLKCLAWRRWLMSICCMKNTMEWLISLCLEVASYWLGGGGAHGHQVTVIGQLFISF